MTRLILVRHGETEANVEQVWHGSADAPLTPRGQRQVVATARRIAELHREHPIQAFYVSPLPRAQSTAQAIGAAIGMEPVVEPDLREFSIGDWEGRSFRELAQVERLWQRWQSDPSFAPPNGESPIQFSQRVQRVFRRLVERHPGQTILVVTHGGVISNLLAQWLGEGPGDWARWDPPNCAITVLEKRDGVWHPVLVNDVSHLRSAGISPSPLAGDGT